jgi:hypothetical protein
MQGNVVESKTLVLIGTPGTRGNRMRSVFPSVLSVEALEEHNARLPNQFSTSRVSLVAGVRRLYAFRTSHLIHFQNLLASNCLK